MNRSCFSLERNDKLIIDLSPLLSSWTRKMKKLLPTSTTRKEKIIIHAARQMTWCGQNSSHADMKQFLCTITLGTLNYPPRRDNDEISYPKNKEVVKCLGIPGSIRRERRGRVAGKGIFWGFELIAYPNSWMHCGCRASPIILPTIQEIHVTTLDVCDTFWRLPPLHTRLCWFSTVHSSSNDILLTSVCSVSPFTDSG